MEKQLNQYEQDSIVRICELTGCSYLTAQQVLEACDYHQAIATRAICMSRPDIARMIVKSRGE